MGLRLTRQGGDRAVAIDLRYAGGTTYVATVDQAALVACFFGAEPVDQIDPVMLATALTASPWLGQIVLLPAGQDLILVQPATRPPELLARCP